MHARPTRWTCRPYAVAAADRIAAELGLSHHTAAILVRRGHETVGEARRFLEAGERHDPPRFADMEAVCDRILGHLASDSRIVVHGDYDVDGVCATAVLVRALRRLGGDPSWHLPSRVDDGYGLSRGTVARLAAEGTGLLITVDCAVTAAAEVEEALGLGLDVIVTDHHRPAERLPPCPILHPALSGYPFTDLCATAVAHKLGEALQRVAGLDPAAAGEDLDLVALATVADLVPLTGENRRLVRAGLRALARTRKPGLRALVRVAGVDPGALSEHALGFSLAPRLNAAGRLQRADAALELLLTEDEARGAEVAGELDRLNHERRDTETRILFAAEAARSAQAGAPAYVLAGEGWHAGVIGIVASRMVERYHRPCVVIALDGDGGRGSGRSIPAYDLHAGLAACARHLRRFGGHRVAAGLELDRERVDAFRDALAAHAGAALSPGDLEPVETVDAVIPGDALGHALAEELDRLAPFGQGNPRPTLLVPAGRVCGVGPMGEGGQHARFTVSSGGARARAVAFRQSPRSLEAAADEPHDIAARLELNEWNGAVEPRLVLRALCPTEPGPWAVVGGDEPFWAAVARELSGDPAAWAPAPGEPRRELRDRRGRGFAGVTGDLLSSGERVLVLCADVSRRRDAIERLLGGLARGGEPALASWDALAGDPSLARPFEHLVALDPPPLPAGEALLVAAPADATAAFAHLAWGSSEVEFALAVAEAQLDLRAPLAEAYRALREAGVAAGARLEAILQGEGPHPRPPAVCGRLLRVLLELGVVSWEEEGPEGPACRVLDAPRTALERSRAHRAYGGRLAAARRYLSAAAGAPGRPAPGFAGAVPPPARVAQAEG